MTTDTSPALNETPSIQYCAKHPNVETNLRCNNCGKLICAKCAVRTPIGYRCKECVSGQQKVFETALWQDYPIAFFSAGLLAFLGGLIIDQLGFLALFVAPMAGAVIGEVVRWLTRRRRSKTLFQLAAGGAALGSLIPMLIILVGWLLGVDALSTIWSLVWHGYYAFMVTSTCYYRLGGIQIK